MKMPIKKRNPLQPRQVVPVLLAVAILGASLVWRSFAAGTPIAFEPETGAITGSATSVGLTGASEGAGVKFGPEVWPDASNTGVPAGTTLSPITDAYPNATTQGYSIDAQGRVTITKDGGVYENVLITGGVSVKAKNVTIRSSRITGGRSSFPGLLAEPTSWSDCRSKRQALEAVGQNPPSLQLVDANSAAVVNLTIEDSELAVTDYSIYINSFMGHDTTMRRVDLSGGVDAIGIYSGSSAAANFRIERSYLHDLYRGQWSLGNYNIDPASGARVYCGYDASHPEATHNDGIQMHGGSGIDIVHNTIAPKPVNHTQANAGIMMNVGSQINVDDNHFQYGVCSINMVSGLGLPVTVTNNTFYGNNNAAGTGSQGAGNCAIIRPAAASYTFSGNTWSNGAAVALTNGG